MGIEDYIYKYELKYREFDKKSSANTNIYKPEVIIKGMRVKGYKKYTDSKDGTSVTCSIMFRVPEEAKWYSDRIKKLPKWWDTNTWATSRGQFI